MDYKRQLKEADSILHKVTGTHQNILSIGGDLFSRYEQACEERLKRAVLESEEKLLRHHTELTERAVAEAVQRGVCDKETALEEAGLERERALAARERQVREEMEMVATEMVREERERGERSLEAALAEASGATFKVLAAREEEVRLEEQLSSEEKLNELENQMNEEIQLRILETVENGKIILEEKLAEVREEEANHLQLVRERDRDKAETEIDAIEAEFNEKFTYKQNEIVALISTIQKLEQELASKDEQIKKLKTNYEDSRTEFSHFVDTVTDLGGGYTVRKKIS